MGFAQGWLRPNVKTACRCRPSSSLSDLQGSSAISAIHRARGESENKCDRGKKRTRPVGGRIAESCGNHKAADPSTDRIGSISSSPEE